MSNRYNRDDHGNRMKSYENTVNSHKLMANLPVIIRLDGKKFSKLSKILNLDKPYDENFSLIMKNTAEFLLKNVNKCVVAYTQSDEISLILDNTYDSPVDYDRRTQKLCSTVASLCSVYFNTLVKDHYSNTEHLYTNVYPTFDARVYNVPSWIEASNVLLWRELDATKNSIQGLGQSKLTENAMRGRTNKEVQAVLLKDFDCNWNDFPNHFKRGTYFVRYKNEENKTLIEELENLPPLNTLNISDRLSVLFRNLTLE